MRSTRNMRLVASLCGLLLVATCLAAVPASAQSTSPSMTVTPQSGVRPLTVTVSGSPCSEAGSGSNPPVRLGWAVDGSPSTQQIRTFTSEAGVSWSQTLELGPLNVGTNTIEAACLGPADEVLVQYPAQQVDVLPVPPALTASPTSTIPTGTIAATATQCPDPEGPILGGGYFVRFTLEYLVPPSGTEGPYSESTAVWTNQDGVATTDFTLPADAPTEGGTYELRASCELEEFGAQLLFNYTTIAIQVSPQPTPTPTPEPTATAAPTSTPVPTATPAPTATPTPQPTAAPTSTPVPTPQPTATSVPPRPRPVFTG